MFNRKTRPVRFTSAGNRLLKLADEVLPLVHGTEQDVARLAGGESGRIFMAIECHSCFDWLLPAINLYRESWPDALFTKRRYGDVIAFAILMQRPVGQTNHATAACDQLNHHRRKFGLAHSFRLDTRRIQKRREDVQTTAVDGVGNQHFVGQVARLDIFTGCTIEGGGFTPITNG